VNEFAEAADEVALVIDDYHVVESPDAPVDGVLLDHLPPTLHGAGQPQRPAAAAREVACLRTARRARARALLHPRGGRRAAAEGQHLPDGIVTALGERTEGWAACTSRCRCKVAGTSAGLRRALWQPPVRVDYLTEVLERPAELRTFLLETSILDRLCGPL
jgi:LuxR family maltose regulon positive regulatory protein